MLITVKISTCHSQNEAVELLLSLLSELVCENLRIYERRNSSRLQGRHYEEEANFISRKYLPTYLVHRFDAMRDSLRQESNAPDSKADPLNSKNAALSTIVPSVRLPGAPFRTASIVLSWHTQ